MAIIKIDGLITTSISEAEDILADGVSTTDFLPEGTNHLYYTDSRVQSVIDNSEVHVVIDDAGVAPKMLTRNGASEFEFETDDQTYGGTYSATLNMISWADLSQDLVHVLAYQSTAGNLLFNLSAVGPDDDASHLMEFNLRGAHGVLQCRTSGQGGGGDLTSMTVKGTELEFNAKEGAVNVTVTDEFDVTTTPLRVQSDQIEIKAPIKSFFNDGNIMAGGFNDLLDSKRIETNSGRWNRSRSAMRATTNADLDDGNGIQQFSGGFGTDTSYSINNSEIATIGVAVYGPSFNVDNTLDYGIGQSSLFNVRMRGEGYAPGTPPLESFKIEPWSSRYTINSSSGLNNLRLETNAPAVEDTKPHVFVNLTTTERDALTAEPGMMIFNTDGIPKLQCYDGTAWNNLH